MYCSEKHFQERLISWAMSVVIAFGLLFLAEPNETTAADRTLTLANSITEDSVGIKEPEELYARSAVLMDADSGRILFAKNGTEERPMASTTKIMTCILALESEKNEQVVVAGQNAVIQPEVHLGVRAGQQFLLKDLLYSLMLESHNDAAIMIAEGVAGSTEQFAAQMNKKAREIGCSHTYFITPNGLDAEDENGKHHTTAEDLARIMRYCIEESPQREQFLEITQTEQYSFSDIEKQNNYTCYNHNAFLKMMQGALSGKTGFTAQAGYCYVGALRRDKRTFIVVLLACGWPSNRGYKWADTRKLMTYGLEHFHYHTLEDTVDLPSLPVENGVPDEGSGSIASAVKIEERREKNFTKQYLLRDDEKVRCVVDIKKELEAPVEKGVTIGTIDYMAGNEVLCENSVITAEKKEKYTIWYCFHKIMEKFLMDVKKDQEK